MILSIKHKIEKKWVDINMKDLLDMSILDYMSYSDKEVMAAVVDNEEKEHYLMIVSNRESHRKLYEKVLPDGKKQPLFFTVPELYALFSDNVMNRCLVNTFPDSSLVEIKTIENTA